MKKRRQIWFRGQSIHTDIWVYGYLVEENTRSFICTGELIHAAMLPSRFEVNSHEVYPDSVGQYTGIDDLNDVKIYEGYNIKANDSNTVFTVIYGKGRFYGISEDGDEYGSYTFHFDAPNVKVIVL